MSELNVLIERIKQYQKDRGWDKLSSSDLAKSIVIESAELLEHFQWESASDNQNQDLEGIQSESADIFIYLLQFCMIQNIDLIKATNQKLDKVEKKYPADKVKGSQEEYLKLKMNHRSK